MLLAGFEPAPPSYLGLAAVMVGKRLSHRSSVVHARVQQITGIVIILFTRTWGASGVASTMESFPSLSRRNDHPVIW